MDMKLMMEAFAPVAAIASVDDKSPYRNAQTLMTDKRYMIVRLLSVISGKDPQEILSQNASACVCSLLRWCADGGEAFARAVHHFGAELVCTVLYEYRPLDIDALYYLLGRKCREDVRTRYIADSLRLLVMSKLEKGTHYPTLQEILEPGKAEPDKTGVEIMNDIFSAVRGKRGKET